MLRLIGKLLYTVVFLIQVIIVIASILQYIHASDENRIVYWIYRLSDYFISPFKGIISNNIVVNNYSVDFTPLIALVFYMILAFIVVELIKTFATENNNNQD